MLYFVNTPWWLKRIYPKGIWNIPVNDRSVFLTFDDGPHPEVTSFVLDQLKKFNAKASFFCIGKNVVQHPDIFNRIIAEGHSVGNHTMHHANGWSTDDEKYISEINDARSLIDSNLFRPPYGRIKHSQIKKVISAPLNYQLIMWSILSGDFDTSIDGNKCYKNVIKNINPGSIIVFHDSAKAFPRLKVALPLTLEWLQQNQYKAKSLSL